MKSSHILDENKIDEIVRTLARLGFNELGQRIVSVSKAGEGNMNLVLRVKLGSGRSVVLKQSRPWVEKYPSIAAPDERTLAEIAFYDMVSKDSDVVASLPRVLARELESRILVLEDLGASTSYTSLYSCGEGVDEVFASAAAWLAKLHRVDVGPETEVDQLQCLALRQLNHEHIFAIPLMEPAAIDLDAVCDGLAIASNEIRHDAGLKVAMANLGAKYLQSGKTLLHGDFYPGSWLETNDGLRVIDPEFCFLGAKEFDLGVLLAHQIFCSNEETTTVIRSVLHAYGETSVDLGLMKQFAGCEIIRRLIGVAQLPLVADLRHRVHWLAMGRDLVLNGG